MRTALVFGTHKQLWSCRNYCRGCADRDYSEYYASHARPGLHRNSQRAGTSYTSPFSIRQEMKERLSEPVRNELLAIRKTYTRIVLVQCTFFILLIIASPSYLIPLLKHEKAIPWEIGIVCAEALLIWTHEMLRPISRWKRISCYAITLMFGVAPTSLIPLIGPAIVTVSNSLCNGLVGGGSLQYFETSQRDSVSKTRKSGGSSW